MSLPKAILQLENGFALQYELRIRPSETLQRNGPALGVGLPIDSARLLCASRNWTRKAARSHFNDLAQSTLTFRSPCGTVRHSIPVWESVAFKLAVYADIVQSHLRVLSSPRTRFQCTVTFTGNHMAHHACSSTLVVGVNDHFCVRPVRWWLKYRIGEWKC